MSIKSIRKLILATTSFVILIAGTTAVPLKAHAYSGDGAGTDQDPYIITSCEELASITDDTSASYKLANNLNCASESDWVSIGAFDNKFSGSLDGDGHTISGIYQNHDPSSKFGLFSFIQDATIKNVNLNGTIVNTSSDLGTCIGGLAQLSTGSLTISNVQSSIDISANEQSTGAGFIGCLSASGGAISISNSSVNAAVTGAAGGGFIGEMHIDSGATLSIVNSSTNGMLVCEYTCGGLVQLYTDEWDGIAPRLALTIENSHSSMAIDHRTGKGGGLIAQVAGNGLDANISNTYFNGVITSEATESDGGFFGHIQSTGHTPNIRIDQSYVDTNIATDGDYAGGFVGNNGSSLRTFITESFANVTITGSGNHYGGFAGGSSGNISISNSFADVELEGSTHVGGLVGEGANITVDNSYAIGSINSTSTVLGGLIGASDTANVSDSFAAVNIASSTPTTIGGLIGTMNSGSVTNSYVDSTTSTQGCNTTYGIGGTISEFDCTAQSTNYFKYNANKSPINEWDFVDTWAVTSQYPCLNWYDSCIGDSDSDGITNAVESSAPNNGDANNDGTPDAQQSIVASFINPITNQYQVIVAGACDVFESIQTGSEASEPADSGYDYPTGLTEFRALCGGPGQVGSFSQYFYGVENNSKFVMRKWNGPVYETMQGVTFSEEQIDGQTALRVDYQITDGGLYDEDGEANAYIVDPAGVALPVSATSPNSTALASTGQSAPLTYMSATGIIGLAVVILTARRMKKQRKLLN